MNLQGKILGAEPRLLKKVITPVNTSSTPVVPFKNAVVPDVYNLARLSFKNNYSVEFRVYDDGVAYRFITNEPGDLIVENEDVHINFTGNYDAWLSPTRSFKCDYQIIYRDTTVNGLEKAQMTTLPVLVNAKNRYKILISESDLFDYPAMFFHSRGNNTMDAAFPQVPTEFGDDGDRSVKLLKEAPYIAKTKGSRSFPWRFFVITDSDKNIVGNQMAYKLSAPPASTDVSWIKPGHVTWEWWHGARIYGVDFKAGLNLDTYKYYIDFAAKFNIPYIIMDEGWAKSTMDPLTPNPGIDLLKLIEYGNSKNVKIILWFTWLCVENNFDSVFKTLQDWGIAGMKIDFMDRSDQWMVNYYERVAKEAATHHLLVDYHGAFKPAGLEKKYPNVLSYEGVVGMEMNIYAGIATPANNVLLPFIRNAVGPMDYTPGAMFTAQPEDYHGNWTNTMSIGTRASQMAMYIVYESGLQMMADNPMNYYNEPGCAHFIADVPVTWDETKVLDAKAGEYVITARRKNNKWYIGALNNGSARTITVKADFLGTGEHQLTAYADGINAGVQAMDYKKTVTLLHNDDTITISMERNGGYAASIE